MANENLNESYLPFTETSLQPHFTEDWQRHLDYFRQSSSRYQEFLSAGNLEGVPISKASRPRQIEKDERFWVVTALKQLFEDPDCLNLFDSLLSECFGSQPPIRQFDSWLACLKGELKLYFEACFPSPKSYLSHLESTISDSHLIPYIVDASKREHRRTFEGATHVDALITNETNGFAWFIEAKVLSDISYNTSFNVCRNQIARNIDIMIDDRMRNGESAESLAPKALRHIDPALTLFSLLTPTVFRENRHTRLYGWLFDDYKHNAGSIRRDLSHRVELTEEKESEIRGRIGWITFEQINKIRPNACPWIS